MFKKTDVPFAHVMLYCINIVISSNNPGKIGQSRPDFKEETIVKTPR